MVKFYVSLKIFFLGVFVLKIRDHKADELCIFQLTNGNTVELGIFFFDNLIKRVSFKETFLFIFS